MKELVVDTSVWIEAFKGRNIPLLEEALQGGRVTLPPIVLAELLSGIHNKREEKSLTNFLSYVPLHPIGRSHWKKVGLLRSHLQAKELSVSIPDCHIVQCCLEMEGSLLTYDKIFLKIASFVKLNVVPQLV